MARTTRSITSLAIAILSLRALSSLMTTGYIYYPTWTSNMELQLPSFAASSQLPISNDHSSTTTRISREFPSIVPGDLPGYTGWSRPFYTEAPFYEIESITPSHARKAHEALTLIVRCSQCSSKSFAQFYVRMYGPSILSGHVTDLNKGRYEVKFLPRIAGKYWIEVVLTFSKAEDYGNYPVKTNEPSYEGYLLPNFPLAVEVGNHGDGDDSIGDSIPFEDRLCDAQDLQVEGNNDGMYMASWRITKKINDAINGRQPSILQLKEGNKLTLTGYQEGGNSLGIFADYQPINCNLLAKNHSFATLLQSCSVSQFNSKPIRIVFIGDSNVRLQRDHFAKKVRGSQNVKTTWVKTYGGIIETLGKVESALSKLDSEKEEIVIIFNTGLHDISILCTSMDHRVQQRSGYMPADYTCVDEYQKAFIQLVEAVSSFPARIKIFQTTTAGWMRWGNFGFAWPPVQVNQSFPQSTYFVDTFNHIAFRVLENYDDIDIMDGYWITLARPDNREIDKENAIGKRLVHPGLEVLRALVRTWMTILSSKLGC